MLKTNKQNKHKFTKTQANKTNYKYKQLKT